MHPSTAVLLLVFVNAVSSEPNCVQIPDVPNAELQNRKEVYVLGDTIVFTCLRGYVQRPIQHICSESGWVAVQKLSCRLKPCVLPDDIPNGYYQISVGEDFVFGTTIQYFCNEGYQMISKEDTRTCYHDGWSNHLPVCESLSCEAPTPVPGLTVEGLPFDDGPILPDRFLRFSCPHGLSLNGSQTLVCGRDGTWDGPLPNCIVKQTTCEIPASDNKVHFSGAAGALIPAGDWVTVQCVREGRSEQVLCLPDGHWSPFPTCRDSCDVVGVSDTVLVSPRNVKQRQTGQTLRFRCSEGSHVLQGAEEVTCLEDGRWSQSFPSCSDPRACETPPPLENGDFLASTTQFVHNTRVVYQCQSKYTMEGGPYKTCRNGEWTGEITCLKPCTVNEDLMEPNKVEFRWRSTDKLYAPHKGSITFRCVGEAVHDGVVNLRQQCINGRIELPRCV